MCQSSQSEARGLPTRFSTQRPLHAGANSRSLQLEVQSLLASTQGDSEQTARIASARVPPARVCPS
eukprot:3251948-Pleurochrysis_carterae.AAC.1